MLNFSRKKQITKQTNIVYLINNENHKELKDKKSFLAKAIKAKKKIVKILSESKNEFFVDLSSKEKADYNTYEKVRRAGSSICDLANAEKLEDIFVIDLTENEENCYYFLEGLALTNYQFLKYKKDKTGLTKSLKKVEVLERCIAAKQLNEIANNTEAVFFARDLVNEPLSFLTAPQMAKEFVKMAKSVKLKVEVYDKKKLESLKMGGVLSVNLGSIDPPTFTVLEWKPKNAKNKQPLVLVGKGVVYDTGGLSLKPTANSMDIMKSDMGGAAAVSGAMMAIAKNQLPIYVVALIPATDNRPGLNAYVPGDVIKMHDGTTVEVLNTDAEGRMLLADALSYAKKYKPMLVCDAATLTGAAFRALGPKGVIFMGNAKDETKKLVSEAGNKVFERLVELPLWDEFKKDLNSSIADLKNVGGSTGGAITAGKFLEHFTDYPWMHFDIAPMAWMYSKDAYRVKDGSGVGVRLFYEMAKALVS